MFYAVKARFDEKVMDEFYRKLADGTIQTQKPDGAEIVESMKRAKITSPNTIEWCETCYCSPPLKHERETVYNHFLNEIETKPITDEIKFEGESFMDFLKNH